MASLSTDKRGSRVLQFTLNDERKTIRLGQITKKQAESVRIKVEALVAARLSGLPMDGETAAWLGDIDDKLHAKLAKAGLVPARETRHKLLVRDYFPDWLARKKANGFKPASLVAWGQCVDEIVRTFGDKPLAALTQADGERYRDQMRERQCSNATIHKRLAKARQMLGDAVRQELIPKNPWEHVRHRQGNITKRREYVSTDKINRVLAACPNVHWRLLVALARFAGLRVPSEPFSMTWKDVNWESERLTIPSGKTEHEGKPFRVIPMFPALRPYLQEAFEAAPEGATWIFPDDWRQRAMGPRGWVNANLRTQFLRIIKRAGVEPWTRLFHSLRASCESDLAGAFPLAAVVKWLGNTTSTALGHYVEPTDVAFEQAKQWNPCPATTADHAQALQNALHYGAESNGALVYKVQHDPSKTQEILPSTIPDGLVYNCEVEMRGIEPLTS